MLCLGVDTPNYEIFKHLDAFFDKKNKYY